jgi:NAD(P)-dependent dehydrogenase (short-subunit alcohol dehydrogenase family)
MMDYSGRSIAQLVSLADRVALVTGAARGIGRQIAARLAEAGASVIIADLREDDVATTADALRRQHGTRCTGIAADVADEESIQRLFRRIDEMFGRINVLVNNAGIAPPARLTTDIASDYWDQIQAVNLRGSFLCAREAATRMRAASNGGVIVNIASTAGFQGSIGLAPYVASKHGVVGLTKSLALELAPHAIRVVAVAPGATKTNMLMDKGDPEKVAATLAGRIALGRLAVPDDIARAVLFCVSDMAAFVTGTTIPVDGGMLAGVSGSSAFLQAAPSGTE